MGRWLPEPDLEDGESILWRSSANWAQEANRHVGGTLVVTERRLLFTPGQFDASLGGRSWWAPRGAVVAIREEPRTPGIHFGSAAAGNRRRLRISTAYGGHELFTVNQVRRKVADLQALLGLPPAS